jgi:hypothetical protein
MYNEWRNAAKESDVLLLLVLERWRKVRQSHWICRDTIYINGLDNAIVVAGTSGVPTSCCVYNSSSC